MPRLGMMGNYNGQTCVSMKKDIRYLNPTSREPLNNRFDRFASERARTAPEPFSVALLVNSLYDCCAAALRKRHILFRIVQGSIKQERDGNRDMVKRFIMILCCVTLVSACVSQRPQAVKPPESRQKAYQRPYTVLGTRYEPLQTHAGFVQTGIASWYGEDFHGKRTSNGETYDMHAMTAAHKTLPLGVFVRVRNTANRNEAIVRVNDRGPFVKGRIIDLSYSAAKALGIAVAGTAPVRIEALGYRGSSPDHYTAPENYDSGSYTVQVGAFTNPVNAERLSAEMKKAYGFSEIRSAWVRGEQFYRVYVGKHASLKSAETAEKNLEGHGYPDSFVVSLD